MSLLPNTLTFRETTLTIIDRYGEPWLSAADLARALGYSRADYVTRIYERNKDEFTPAMTLTVNLTVKGFGDGQSKKPVRIFSSRGCYAIGFFAKTKQAKTFRRWVLDVLEAHVRGSGEACRLMPLLALTRKRWGHVYTPNGFNTVSLNTALVLDYLLENCNDGQWHTMSHRAMGREIGITHASVQIVLGRLAEWGLISRKPGSRGVAGALRVHSRKIRQQLKHGSLGADDQLPWLH